MVQLLVFEDGELISDGTGSAITPDGVVLTAAHVIAGGFPVRKGEVDSGRRSIVGFRYGEAPIAYRPLVCPIEVKTPGLKTQQIDICLLTPTGLVLGSVKPISQ